eukprot:755528-Hanusia_phi.AAC.1
MDESRIEVALLLFGQSDSSFAPSFRRGRKDRDVVPLLVLADGRMLGRGFHASSDPKHDQPSPPGHSSRNSSLFLFLFSLPLLAPSSGFPTLPLIIPYCPSLLFAHF